MNFGITCTHLSIGGLRVHDLSPLLSKHTCTEIYTYMQITIVNVGQVQTVHNLEKMILVIRTCAHNKYNNKLFTWESVRLNRKSLFKTVIQTFDNSEYNNNKGIRLDIFRHINVRILCLTVWYQVHCERSCSVNGCLCGNSILAYWLNDTV